MFCFNKNNVAFKFSQFCKVKNKKTIFDAKQGVEIDNFLLESIFNLGCNRRVILRLPRVPGKNREHAKMVFLNFDKKHTFSTYR